MINHSEIRAAIKSTLQADALVLAVIDRAGWYTLTTPKAIRSPAVVMGGISQPLVGVAGSTRRQVRFDAPMTASVLILCEKHDIEEGDDLMGDAAGKVYDTLNANKGFGLAGLHTNIVSMTSGAYPKLGDNVVGTEILINCTFDE